MIEQLDEHLSGDNKPPAPKFPILVRSFLVYILLLALGFVLFYTLTESLGLMARYQNPSTFLGLFIRESFPLLMWSIIFLLGGHYLQGQAYPLYQESIIKTAMVPFIFWFVILILSFIGNSMEGSSPIQDIPRTFLILCSIISWYFTLCLLISWYFKHQSKPKYFGSFLAHWLVSTLMASLYQYPNLAA